MRVPIVQCLPIVFQYICQKGNAAFSCIYFILWEVSCKANRKILSTIRAGLIIGTSDSSIFQHFSTFDNLVGLSQEYAFVLLTQATTL
jgi:hypothetical protein